MDRHNTDPKRKWKGPKIVVEQSRVDSSNMLSSSRASRPQSLIGYHWISEDFDGLLRLFLDASS